MNKSNRHKWIFTSRFRVNAFGWRASRLACQRIKEAVSEIKKVAKKNPLLGAEGVVKFSEKLWPALQHVDSSTGALGTAVNKAFELLLPILIEAPSDQKTRDKWLDRLWEAIEDDGVDYLYPLKEKWGEICGSKEVASAWADELISSVRHDLTNTQPCIPFMGNTACLSCLLAAERFHELLELLDSSRHKFWHYRYFGALALFKMGKKKEAIRYAEDSRGLNTPDILIDRVCEDILFSSGFYEEAYKRYGLTAHNGMTYLARFRAIVRRYPMKEKTEILLDLVASTPGEEGKWFAAAKDAGCFDLALDLVNRSYCDPKTLNRAARDYQETNPEFALGVAIASLKWIAHGYGYEIIGKDVIDPYKIAIQTAESLGTKSQAVNTIQEIASWGNPENNYVRRVLDHIDILEKHYHQT
jgi:tetratricopeptide (TPR) repeat protein